MKGTRILSIVKSRYQGLEVAEKTLVGLGKMASSSWCVDLEEESGE